VSKSLQILSLAGLGALLGGCVDRAIYFGAASGGAGGDSNALDDGASEDDGDEAEEVGGEPEPPVDPCLDDPSTDCDGDGVPNGDDPFPGGGDPGPASGAVLYANTPTALYTVDPVDFSATLIGEFRFEDGVQSITDIAIDRFGFLYAVGTDALFACDPVSVECTYLAQVPGVNAAGFVPSAEPGGDDTLVLSDFAGDWWRVNLLGNDATVDRVGNNGIGSSSGDIAASAFNTVASIDIGNRTELHYVDPLTGASQGQVIFLETPGAWGLAYYGNELFAFSPTGQITLGNGTVVQTGYEWWGAATFPGSSG
jgi:hypothetical protein